MTIVYLFAWHGEVWAINSRGEMWRLRGNGPPPRGNHPAASAAEVAQFRGYSMAEC